MHLKSLDQDHVRWVARAGQSFCVRDVRMLVNLTHVVGYSARSTIWAIMGASQHETFYSVLQTLIQISLHCRLQQKKTTRNKRKSRATPETGSDEL